MPFIQQTECKQNAIKTADFLKKILYMIDDIENPQVNYFSVKA